MPSKPKLGQNFLNDANAVERIAAALGDLSSRTVIEIGPGGGAITGALAARARQVLAIELDHDLAADLRSQFPADKLTVVEQDVLHFDFASASASALASAPASALPKPRPQKRPAPTPSPKPAPTMDPFGDQK